MSFEYKEDEETLDIYSYQGVDVVVIKVIQNGDRTKAIVEDEDGEQFEVFKDQLY